MISIIYEVEVEDDSKLQAGDDASKAEYVSLYDLIDSPEKLAFDHYQILRDFIISKDYLNSRYKF